MSSVFLDIQVTRTGSEPLIADDSQAIARRFGSVRDRTLSLVVGLDWETLSRQHSPILSPIIWDLGHVANFEEIWLGQRLGRRPPIEKDFQNLFDAISNPRPTRDKLPLPAGRHLLGYLDRVRRQTWEVLKESRGTENRQFVADGFVYEMVAEHEEQHQETILQLLQLLEEPFYVPGQRRDLPDGTDQYPEMVLIPGGQCLMGWAGRGFAYDNEKERHEVDVPSFFIDRTPVTCGDFLTFVEKGGYSRRGLWSKSGWAWRNEIGAEAPANWHRNGSKWQVRSMDRSAPVPENKPVIHVSYHEAEAFARFVGKRLPTETEWEKSALWDPEAQQHQSFPWGEDPPTPERANLDQLAFEPADVGAYPRGISAYGVHQMIGDVWEWTSSDLLAYPGFQPYPYPEYSDVFFGGDFKVLRGGSWATRPAVARGTFRNWDYPIRRQIFVGFRCARDA